jgi:hypothetical protein
VWGLGFRVWGVGFGSTVRLPGSDSGGLGFQAEGIVFRFKVEGLPFGSRGRSRGSGSGSTSPTPTRPRSPGVGVCAWGVWGLGFVVCGSLFEVCGL